VPCPYTPSNRARRQHGSDRSASKPAPLKAFQTAPADMLISCRLTALYNCSCEYKIVNVTLESPAEKFCGALNTLADVPR